MSGAKMNSDSGSDQGKGYTWFIERLRNLDSNVEDEKRLGFDSKHRLSDIKVYAEYIFETIQKYSTPTPHNYLVDIGAGGGKLSLSIQNICQNAKINYLAIDSAEIMNSGISFVVNPIFGRYPEVDAEVILRTEGKTQYVIANSVIHYVKNDGILDSFIRGICNLVLPSGVIFLGDVPSAHLKTAQKKVDDIPYEVKTNDFTSSDFMKIAEIAETCSCSLYILPQPRIFPMHPHRADLILIKHSRVMPWK